MPHDDAALTKPRTSWPGMIKRSEAEVAAYDGMIANLREFLDKVAGAKPDDVTLAALTQNLAAWSDRLSACAVDERDQMFGRMVTRSGRGQATAPALIVDENPVGELRGRVTFGRYFLGVNGAVHGGVLPLLFDEVLGRTAADPAHPRIRTAYLNTAFKALTPLDTELAVVAWLDRVEGRKRFVRGELRHGEVVCAEAEALFVELKPDQG